MKILEWDIYPSPDKAVKIVQDDHYYPLFDLNYSRTACVVWRVSAESVRDGFKNLLSGCF